MGLDMFLHGANGGVVDLDGDGNAISLEGTAQIAYWRKDIYIHEWFNSLLEGDFLGNCQAIPVKIEDLKKLVQLSEKILRVDENRTIEDVAKEIDAGDFSQFDIDLAKRELPAETESFLYRSFVGYGAFYFYGVLNTLRQLKPVVELEVYEEYFYYAWW